MGLLYTKMKIYEKTMRKLYMQEFSERISGERRQQITQTKNNQQKTKGPLPKQK